MSADGMSWWWNSGVAGSAVPCGRISWGGGFRCFLQPLQTNSGVVSTSDEAATVVSFHILANSLFADHFFVPHCLVWTVEWVFRYLMSIEPCIIVIVDEWKTNLMSLAILFHLVCAQHVSDINISIFRSLRLCWWWCSFCRLKHKLCFSLQNEHHPKPAAPNLQHTTNWEQDDRCGNSTTQSQAPEDGYINVRNMLST